MPKLQPFSRFGSLRSFLMMHACHRVVISDNIRARKTDAISVSRSHMRLARLRFCPKMAFFVFGLSHMSCMPTPAYLMEFKDRSRFVSLPQRYERERRTFGAFAERFRIKRKITERRGKSYLAVPKRFFIDFSATAAPPQKSEDAK